MNQGTAEGAGARCGTLRLLSVPLFLVVFAVYTLTAAPATLFGDPSEYQFIPAILGIAHPPGYAFYTLLAKAWQLLVPVGTIAYRTNLLAAAAGAWVVALVYLIVRSLQCTVLDAPTRLARTSLVPTAAALTLAASPDFWQHAIHANAHIISAALAVTHLWLLVEWWRMGNDRWLFFFALTLGLAACHHPITLMGVPAYGAFILVVRPCIWRSWKLILLVGAGLLLGLSPLLYYPLRSPSAPFGPTDMQTWEGFVGHVTARGLRVNLFHFGLADQLDRVRVFWSLLRLQFPLPFILLLPVGLCYLVRRLSKSALLISLFLLVHLAFTLNTVQDVMAYLLLPFAALAIIAGAGLVTLLDVASEVRVWRTTVDLRNLLSVLFLLLFTVLPFLKAASNLRAGISLRDFTAAEEWVASLHQRFDGQGEKAVLLSDWEHLTPLWVHTYTQGDGLSDSDVVPVYVSTSNPWVDSVWAHIEEGPIYLPDYRPAVRDAGFRLVPEDGLYRVVAPPVTDAVPDYSLDIWVDDRVHILGYDLPQSSVRAGDPVVLVLYQSTPDPMSEIWMPYARVGAVEARWTTDSRVLTPQWQPGEIIVERYEIPLPFSAQPGRYTLRLGYDDLTGGRASLPLSTGGTEVELTTLTVGPPLAAPAQGILSADLANLDNQVALEGARARVGWQHRKAFWQEPLRARAGQSLHLTLYWCVLTSPRDSFTVFIHLIDSAGRFVVGHDYTPLGGAYPSYLWFPKWLPGQKLTDPYRLVLPNDLPSGDYWVEIGMYGMTSLRRLPVVDSQGNLAGDRVILGPVRVE